MKGKRKRLLLVACGIAFGLLAWREVTKPKPGTVEYHLARFRTARVDESWKLGPSSQIKSSSGLPQPSDTRDYFLPKTWLWFSRGRPTIESCVAETETHRKALLHLGYFEERNYVLPNKSFSMLPILTALQASNTLIHIVDEDPPKFTLTGPKTEMPSIHELILLHLKTP